MPNRALLSIHQNDAMATRLKRLALIFDEIYYIPPTVSVLKLDPERDRDRFKRVAEEGPWYIDGFSYARDTEPGLSVADASLKGRDLATTVAAFRRAGILRPCQFAPGVWHPLPDDLIDLMHHAAEAEIEDDTFLDSVGATRDDFSKPIAMGRMSLGSRNVPQTQVTWVNPPMACNVSHSLSLMAYYAEQRRACPILLDRPYIKAMAVRADRAANIANAMQQHGLLKALHPAQLPAKFGAIANELTASIFTDARFEKLTAEEVVDIRADLDIARRRFVSEHVLTLTQMAEAGPWTAEVASEVERYISTTLRKSVLEYDAESAGVLDHAAGRLTVRGMHVFSNVAGGSGLGSLAATATPNGDLWALLLFGAAAGALKASPQFVRDVADCIIEHRKLRRHPIAFVRRISE